jgi:hypothetical protein
VLITESIFRADGGQVESFLKPHKIIPILIDIVHNIFSNLTFFSFVIELLLVEKDLLIKKLTLFSIDNDFVRIAFMLNIEDVTIDFVLVS